jgi:hypothetical protein
MYMYVFKYLTCTESKNDRQTMEMNYIVGLLVVFTRDGGTHEQCIQKRYVDGCPLYIYIYINIYTESLLGSWTKRSKVWHIFNLIISQKTARLLSKFWKVITGIYVTI